jgi:hypothetical protein
VKNLKRSLLILAAVIMATGGWLVSSPAPAGAATCPPPPLELEHHIRYSNSAGPSDQCVPDFIQGTDLLYCDTDGDGSDFIVWFDFFTATWFDSDTETTYHYGRPGDFPICGDWDGDGTDGIAVVRGPTWFLRNAASGGNANLSFGYGRADDFPIAGDWNGDGSDTPGVVRGNIWYLRNSNSAGNANLSFGYGRADDFPISADTIAQGMDTPVVVRFVGGDVTAGQGAPGASNRSRSR